MKLQHRADAALTLQQLNADCLHLIFQHLNVCEQYALLKLSTYFESIVRRIWRRKYSEILDLAQETHTQELPAAALSELLSIIAGLSKKLLNLDAVVWNNFSRKCAQTRFANITQISIKHKADETLSPPPAAALELSGAQRMFPALETLHLECVQICFRHLRTLSTLNDLQLKWCTHAASCNQAAACNLSVIFRLLHLKSLTYLPHAQPHARPLQQQLKCATLQQLTLRADDLAGGAALSIAQLPQLHKLTVVGSDGATTAAALTHVVAAAAQIVAVRIKCHFERQLVLQLLQHDLPHLSEFAWHSHLHVDYVRAAGVAKWQAHDPRMRGAVLKFIAASRRRLQVLDFRWNCHVSPEFMGSVWQTLMTMTTTSGAFEMETKVLSDYGAGDDRNGAGEEHTMEREELKDYGYIEFKLRSK